MEQCANSEASQRSQQTRTQSSAADLQMPKNVCIELIDLTDDNGEFQNPSNDNGKVNN